MSEATAYPCPYCNTNELETTASAPYVRGFGGLSVWLEDLHWLRAMRAKEGFRRGFAVDVHWLVQHHGAGHQSVFNRLQLDSWMLCRQEQGVGSEKVAANGVA